MYKANQAQLFHTTNVGLVALRQMEIKYYNFVLGTLGFEAVYVGGFTYGVYTVTVAGGFADSDTTIAAYFVLSAITIFVAIYIVVGTLYVQVFGPGLALHGAAGSVAKACEVMKHEMMHMMRICSVMIFFFAVSTVASFWVVMDQTAAAVSSCCFFIALYLWIANCRRIYIKLHWDKSKSAKAMYGDITRGSDNDDNPVNMIENLDTNYIEMSPSNSDQHAGILSSIFNTKKDTKSSEAKEHKAKKKEPKKEIAMEGYLARKTTSKAEAWTKWDRRYCVLNSRGILTGYKDRQEYRNEPKSSLKERPLDLMDFTAYFDTLPNDIGDNMSDITSLTKKGDEKIGVEKFLLMLRSKDFSEDGRQYVFRCDTAEELAMWIQAMKEVMPKQDIK